MDPISGGEVEDEANKEKVSTSMLSMPQPTVNCCERVRSLGYDKYDSEEIDLQTIDLENQYINQPPSGVKFGETTFKKGSLEPADKAEDASAMTDWCNMIVRTCAESG